MFQQTINQRIFQVIQQLSDFSEIKNSFYMAGGTALALQLGHRKSDDVDLFSTKKFDERIIANIIQNIGGEITSTATQTIHAKLHSVKVFFIYFPYKMIEPLNEKLSVGKIKLASVSDIACMKIMAISQRAEKKDFFDLYEILKTNSPKELKIFLLKKFGENKINCYHILRSIFYFDDVEETVEPISLNKTKWSVVRKFLAKNEKIWVKEMLNC